MERQQQFPDTGTEVHISLEDSTIRSCSLEDGRLDITLTKNLRLQFSPTKPAVRRYLYVAENGPRGQAPDDFVERVEQLLRAGLLGVPRQVDLNK